jgi:cation transport regulator ChaC
MYMRRLRAERSARDAQIEHARSALGEQVFPAEWVRGRTRKFMNESGLATQPAERPVIRLLPGQTALVGYGSLLSLPSLERTLGRVYTGPFLPCIVRGWRRTWDAAMPNRTFYEERPGGRMTPETILYLNVRRAPETNLPAIVFVVGAEELDAYDRREAIYDRVDVTDELNVRIEGGRAYIYVCRPENCLTAVASAEKGAIRSTYLRIVENGLAELGEDFRNEYVASTDAVPEHLVIDDHN